MNHLLILPIVLPLLVGSFLVLGHRLKINAKRYLSVFSCILLLFFAVALLHLAGDGQIRLYVLGGWQPPFGIVLMLDRLAAVMLLANAVLALLVLLYAIRGVDESGPNFHALFQFQLLGINGAFLTGDLFNLFVFFEILLIASYALLVWDNSRAQLKAGMHYVLLNLVGSAIFLIGISLLYGVTGTLNMADLAGRVASAEESVTPLLAAAGFLLLIVFGLKAAMLPLHFWLPATYAAAVGPVAALFAIMTKVGLYAILRVFSLIFGDSAGPIANFAQAWLWGLAGLTIIMGSLGLLAARSLQHVLSYLVIVSVGTLLAGFSLGTVHSLSGMLYYLLHSTWVMGGLFLLVDLVARQRGSAAGALITTSAVRQPLLLGSLFFMAAIAVVGLPPFSGFLGKLMLLQAAEGYQRFMLWPILLIGGFVALVVLSRAGSLVFWRSKDPVELVLVPKADKVQFIACLTLLLTSVLLVVLANPLLHYLQATAEQLLDVAPYLDLIKRGDA
ncbi:multicomponent K+:H+ antiporter subunit D [Azomonas agilis]|uniref:Multicomponent K+:H+ antiporter subunit D n=1 Tax=Azomonas agilis TaxID=116849 RepID=A0A562I119_9GAMM|nr:monovalent cation/H+ antiporter subunit D [Azomonas agilis]TWH64739.1 multicomponent K+:H+ antiporter subunit D [Azomonas agilis]